MGNLFFDEPGVKRRHSMSNIDLSKYVVGARVRIVNRDGGEVDGWIGAALRDRASARGNGRLENGMTGVVARSIVESVAQCGPGSRFNGVTFKPDNWDHSDGNDTNTCAPWQLEVIDG